MKDTTHQYIPTLDGWRAVAILLVIFHHDSLHTFACLHKLGHIITFGVFTYGYVGVDVFFAISGILICTLLLNEEQKSQRIDLKAFYVRRVFRIIPPALFYLTVLAILAGCRFIPLRPIDWWGAILFFRNYTHPARIVWVLHRTLLVTVARRAFLFVSAVLFGFLQESTCVNLARTGHRPGGSECRSRTF